MTEPVFSTPHVTVYQGDCLDVLRELPEASVDAIVTDPPYGIGFMGAKWDMFNPEKVAHRRSTLVRKGTPRTPGAYPERMGSVALAGGAPLEYDESADGHRRAQTWAQTWAQEAIRVVKPGGYMLCFGSPRAHHRITSGIEDAGWTIRDCLMWLFGEGYPKSLDISKAFDKRAGMTREVVDTQRMKRMASPKGQPGSGFAQRQEQVTYEHTAPSSDLVREWSGWGTALKPAWEPIILAQRPLDAKTYVENVERHGVGGLNIDASRIGTDERVNPPAGNAPGGNALMMSKVGMPRGAAPTVAVGRWPANLVLDEAAAATLDEQSGERPSGTMHAFHRNGPQRRVYGSDALAGYQVSETYGDTGGASRFFYVGKASTADRGGRHNDHPTVKPLALMSWLVRLVTPPGGMVLDPFAGSGTTLVAATSLGFRSIGIEREPKYVRLIERRCAQLAMEIPA